jgi:uncharacterized membrane protein (DUF106 family)
MVVEIYFGLLTTIFSPVLALPAYIAETIIAGVVVFISTMFYKFLADQGAIKVLREEQKAISKKVKEIQKEDPEKANALMKEALKLTNKQMKMNMKPMIATMVVAFMVFPWIAQTFTGPVLILPFELPFLGAEIGWLAWYFVVAMIMNISFRKALGII